MMDEESKELLVKHAYQAKEATDGSELLSHNNLLSPSKDKIITATCLGKNSSSLTLATASQPISAVNNSAQSSALFPSSVVASTIPTSFPHRLVPQCPTSMSSFPRFPHPSGVGDDRLQHSLSHSRMVLSHQCPATATKKIFHKYKTNLKTARSLEGEGCSVPAVEQNASLRTVAELQPRGSHVSRRTRHFVPNERKDEYYWQKRRKNNEAARKSREKRRTIDSVLEEKVLILSQENKLLRDELRALKAKYGEVDRATDLRENHCGDQIKSDDFLEPKAFKEVLLKSHQNGKFLNESPSVVNPLPPPLSVAATVTLPQVSVIINGNTTPDSSAKLVLSNLASGTLILSPLNLSCKDERSDNHHPYSAGGIPGSSRRPADADEKSENGFLNNEMQAVEAANTLASLFRCNGSAAADQSGFVATSRRSSVPEHEAKERVSSTSSVEECVDVSKDLKKSQSLPYKLRFKTSKFE